MERLDFITSVGYGDGPGARERLGLTGRGPVRVITDLGVLEPDPSTVRADAHARPPGGRGRGRSEGRPAGRCASPLIWAPPNRPPTTELAVLRELEAASREDREEA